MQQPIIAEFAAAATLFRRRAAAMLKRKRSETPTPTVAAAPRRLTAEDQWKRLIGVVQSAILGAQDARQMQLAATQQLDLAQYALRSLSEELAAVMTVPGFRERASVHTLEIAPAPAAAAASALAA